MTSAESAAQTAARLVLDGTWQALTLLALAGAPVAAAWDAARGRGLTGVSERLGRSPRADGVAWIAAASAGEVAAGLPLLTELARTGLAPLALSVGTPHGLRAARRHAGLLALPPFHPPVDASPCVQAALRRLAPRALVTIETEIWPNLFRACARRGVPVAVVNARLSPRAFPRYLRARALVAHALRDVRLVAARTPDDARRWLQLGAPPRAVVEVGNMKFDAAARVAAEPALPWAAPAGLSEGAWIAFGSTAEGEEDEIARAFVEAREGSPGLRAVVAPKRPERWDAVAELLASHGLPVLRRSGFGAAGPDRPVPPGGVLLLDTVGELGRAYRHAALAFVGGSLVPHGGQNLLEPAAAGVPVLFGPHVDNFRDAEEALLASGGGLRVERGRLGVEIRRLLADEPTRRGLGRGARDAVQRHEGATRRTIDHLRPLLEAPGERTR